MKGSRARLLCELSVLPAVLSFSMVAGAGDFKRPELPEAFHAKTYAIHEAHDDERISVALDPYIGAGKESIFQVPYRKNDFLPVRVIVTNDGDKPVSLRDLRVQFISAHREKAEPATEDDIARRLANVSMPRSKTPPLPIPVPRKPSKRLKGGTEEEIEYLQFKARAVEAHSTQAGFFFFDTTGMAQPLSGSRLYLSGIRNAEGEELFYFDLPLEAPPPAEAHEK
jgi:hypothetical protein